MRTDEAQRRQGLAPGTAMRLVLAGVLLVLFALFALANTQQVAVDLLFDEFEMPMILLLAASALVGAVVAELVRWRHAS